MGTIGKTSNILRKNSNAFVIRYKLKFFSVHIYRGKSDFSEIKLSI